MAAEDIVQDVAVRLVASEVHFSSADDLMRWAAAAARNLSIDQWRAESRHGTVLLEEAASAIDVSEIVEHRLRLEAVERSWTRLSERDRQALRAGVQRTAASSRREAVRWAVQRHAARARLAAMVDGAVALLGWLVARSHLHRSARVAAIALAPAMIVAFVVLPFVHTPFTPSNPTEPERELRRGEAVSVTPTTRDLPATPAPATSVGAVRTRAPAARPAKPAAPVLIPYRKVEVGQESAPAYRRVRTRPKGPHDSLLCVRGLAGLPEMCVNPPLVWSGRY